MAITDYFDAHGIEYKTTGKNVSEGWIGVECPFCPDGDPSYHLGISLTTNLMSCWRCGAKGHVVKLVMKLEHMSYESANAALKKFIDVRLLTNEKERGPAQIPAFPAYIQRLFQTKNLYSLRVCEWLENRGFDPDLIYDKYQLVDGGITGRFKHRVFIPVYMQRRPLNAVGRDLTGHADVPYLALPNDQCVLPIKHCLYNIDRAKDTAIIVEGVTDVWRIGDGAVAVFGVQYTEQQILLLSKFRRLFILFDADATERGERLAHELSAVVNDVQQVEISEGDPGDFTQDDVNHLRRQIFGRL